MAVQASVGEYVLGEVLPRPVLESTNSSCWLWTARVRGSRGQTLQPVKQERKGRHNVSCSFPPLKHLLCVLLLLRLWAASPSQQDRGWC